METWKSQFQGRPLPTRSYKEEITMAKRILAITMALLCLSGCAKATEDTVTAPGDSSSATEEGASDAVSTKSLPSDNEMFTARDLSADYDSSAAVTIALNGSSASSSSDSVKISGSTVTITEEATYLISGTLEEGMIVVDAGEKAKPQIVLNNASITSKTSAPLYILSADKVVVTLAEGTENALSNAEGFLSIDDNNIDGAVFSKEDLTFNGTGSLAVTSPKGHGIVCKDDLVFAGGSYEINSASHAIDANDSVRITKASITANAGKDGIHAENSEDTSLGFVYIADGTTTITAEGDGVSASGILKIMDGNFTLSAGGGNENGTKHSSDGYGDFMGGRGPGKDRMNRSEPDSSRSNSDSSSSDSSSSDSSSMKGLKSNSSILILGGAFQIDSADDGIHANISVAIQNGTLNIATGDDGVHADETLDISGGSITIAQSYEGLEAQNLTVSGGEITLTASDDGLNAAGGKDESGFGGRDEERFADRPENGRGGGMSSGNGSILISGGTLKITASGDGIDANGTLEITGGFTTVCGPTQGDTATLDYDVSGSISGGIFIGTGASGMAQTFSDSTQGVIAVTTGNVSAQTPIVLKNASGETVLSHTPELDYAVVILSSPEMKKGETYSLSVGTQTADVTAQ